MNERPVVYFQTDPRWADNDYSARGEQTDIRESGCGPTAAAMVAATWAARDETPANACAWSLTHGYKAPHQGTYYSFFAPYLARFGISCRQLNGRRIDQAGAAYGKPYHTAVFRALSEGALVIACMGPGTWTRSGHFVLLYGVSGSTAYINDPASSAPQRVRGDWAVFRSQVKYYFVCTRPEAPQKEEEMTQEQFDTMLDDSLARRAGAGGSAWSRADRDWAVANKLVQGDGAGNVGWQAHLTLEGAVALIHRLWALMRGEPHA